MQPGKINYYKNKLLDEKSDLLDELDNINDDSSLSVKESTGELSSYDNHPADNASNTYEQEKDRALEFNIESLLDKVDDALQKIRTGKYGTCQKCGKEISDDRLDAVPYSNLCKDCSAAEQFYIDEGDRPYNEGVIDPPYSSSFTDDTDNVGYDGEDTWQDVAQYGTSNTVQDVPGETDYNGEEVFIDADEEVGITGTGDGIFDDEVGSLEEAMEEKSTVTGEESDQIKGK